MALATLRRPARYADQLPAQVETAIVDAEREKPHWSARKIREVLVRRLAGDVRIPATGTIHAVLDRYGLARRTGRKRHEAKGTPLSAGAAPDDPWCADLEGEFELGNGRYCYPLTVTDHASRFLPLCEAMESTREEPVVAAFERLFCERGLPFASPDGLFGSFRAVGLGAAARHRHRAHSPRPSPGKTAATSACTRPWQETARPRPRMPSGSRSASMPSSPSSMASARTRPSP